MSYKPSEHKTGTVITTECALCGAEIDEGQSLAKHLRWKCPEVGNV